MPIFLVVVIAVLVIGLIGLAYRAFQSSGTAEALQEPESDPTVGSTVRRPSVSEFHVKGETAAVVFDVPLGESEVGQHLTDLLSAAAIEDLRARVAEGLPLDGVHRIDVSAMRGDQPESVVVVELPSPSVLPDPIRREAPRGGFMATLNEVVADTSVGARSEDHDTLEPVASFVKLTGPLEARLRMAGVDPSTMSLGDLTRGLLQIDGYTISDAGRVMATAPGASVHTAVKPGERITVLIYPHAVGGYPEVSEKVFGEVGVVAGESKAQRVILVSDMYGPYSMYERERRDKRMAFITRERLQAFVDSFGLG